MPRIKKSFLLLVLPLVALLLASYALITPVEKVSVHLETKALQKGKTLTTHADVYYQAKDGKMLTHYISPVEYIFITNAKGEVTLFDIKKNQVFYNQNPMYSTETTLFYYFLTNKIWDMGLTALGFKLEKSRFENAFVITHWKPNAANAKVFSKVELVHENSLPIYMSYFDTKNKLIRKVYYSNYYDVSELSLPLKITEFSYLPDGDSVITRMNYSNVKINEDNAYFNFSVPKNAKIIK